MDIDAASVDEVLATTRAVRRRLDLDRPVDNELLLDCIDLAEQAPTGGNLGSRRWIIVRDQAVKDQLGELYRTTALPFMSRAAERLRGTGDPQERVMASAAFLAEHLAEVPAIVIPTIIGRHDGSGRPGLFDSVIQAAWSFCLALRARGLGTTWVTAALQDEARVKEILGIPGRHDRDRPAPGGVDEGHRLPACAAPPGTGDHVVRPLRHHVRVRARRRAALRGRAGRVRRGRHRRPAGRRLAAGHRPQRAGRILRGVRRRRVAATTRAASGPCSSGATTTRRSASGRSRASSTPATSRARSAGARPIPTTPAPAGGSTSSRSAARPGCGSPTGSGPGRRARPRPSTANPGKEARVLRRRLGEVHANMQRTVEGIKQLVEGTG